MRRLFKYLFYSLGIFIVLFVLAAAALYFFFDANDFREDISQSVRDNTGRELTIEGDISLDFFPWLAVEVGSSTLGNAEGFGDEPMARFDRASLSVRLLPAIIKQDIVVGGVDIEGLQLNLAVDRNGNSNWDDLIAEDSSEEVTETAPTVSSVNINSIELINASIDYVDQQSGDRYSLRNANLTMGQLSDNGNPVPVRSDFDFDLQPSDFSGAMDFQATLSFDAGAEQLLLDGVEMQGSLQGIATDASDFQLETNSVAVDVENSTVAMEPLTISVLGMDIDAAVQSLSYANDIEATAAIEVSAFSPKTVMQLFDVEPPPTADPAALTSVTLDANAKMTASAIRLTNVNVKMDDTTLTGTMTVPRTDSGSYQFDLVGDSINLDRYMEPATDAEASVASGDEVPVVIPTELIAPLNARGTLKLESATLTDIVLEDVDLGLNASRGKLRIYPITANLFSGTYSGDVRIDASGRVPRLSMNETIKGVDLASLADAMFEQDNITGSISGNFELSGSGTDLQAVQRDLAGNMAFELKDGSYEGTDIWYELRRARAFIKQEEAPQASLPARTAFSTVSMSGVVTNGVMRSNDLFAELPFLQLTGGGNVDLAAATVDYDLIARVLERPEFLAGATAEELDEFTEAKIPLNVKGPIDSPTVTPDIEELLKNEIEEQVEDLIKDKLKDLFD